jgi:transcriptional regulator with XRE-family HTH domain
MKFNGQLLRHLRRQNNYRLKDLAKITKIPTSTLCNYESGSNLNPVSSNLFKLAYVFDRYMDDFILCDESELPDIWGEMN